MLYPLVRSLMLSFYKTAGPRHEIFAGLDNYRFLLERPVLLARRCQHGHLYDRLFLVFQIPLSLGLAMLLNSNAVWCRIAVSLRVLLDAPGWPGVRRGAVRAAAQPAQRIDQPSIDLASRCAGRSRSAGWAIPNLAMLSVLMAGAVAVASASG